MIPAEAVEAAAKMSHYIETGEQWETLAPERQRELLSKTYSILEAAAPYMLAGVADSRDGDLFRFTWAQREWLRGGGE